MKTMRRILFAISFGLVVSFGCSDEPTQQPPPPNQPGAGGAGETTTNAQPTPTPQPTNVADDEEYARPEYPNSNRRNPFQPDPEVVQPQGTVDDGQVRQLDPLERFGVGELALVAIISEVAIPKAMFLDPEGFGHVVKEGDRIGRNGAIISDVRDNEVEITETPDAEEGGQATTRIVKLADRQITTGDETLSEEDREALRRLLQTEEGMRALRETVSQEGEGTNPPTTRQINNQDPRIRGFAPPSQGEDR